MRTARPEPIVQTYYVGVALSIGVASAAFAIRGMRVPGVSTVSPLMVAIAIGMLIRNLLGVPASATPGLAACLRSPLRVAIALLGLQLTLAEILEIGVAGLMILTTAVAATYLFTMAVGRALRVDRGLSQLIAAGTSICGASAVIAANTVVRDRHGAVPYALAVVTLYGTAAMFSYPLLLRVLNLSPQAYGLWVGASMHEVAQVVAAGFAGGQDAGEFGLIAKLTRVLFLAPVILLLGWASRRGSRAHGDGADTRPPVPWFIFGFLALAAVASSGVVAAPLKSTASLVTQSLMAISLAAVGLETDFRTIAARGWRALLLGGLASLFVSTLTLALIVLRSRFT
jgi:uncharacterized integral membrane protein (TIGR00698 family)